MTKHKNRSQNITTINMTYTEVAKGNLLSLQLLSIMRSIIIDVWAHRDSPVWIYGRVTSIVAFLNVLHVNRAVDVLGVIEQIWIFPYKLLVAFEVNRVNL